MMRAPLYLLVVGIWGSTWLAIKYQLGTVHPTASVAYRFSLAALILFAWAAWRRLPMRLRPADHLRLAAVGLTMFSLNYVLFYFAEESLTTGLVAIIFAMVLPLNIVNNWIFRRRRPTVRVCGGALIGLVGLVTVFWPEIVDFDITAAGRGIVLSLLGSLSFSLGNVVSAGNHDREIPLVQGTAFSMAYGAVLMLVVTPVVGGFAFDTAPGYVISLAYLVVFGSLVAFAAYLTLLGRIGPDRAAYATVLFPVVALLLSTVFEEYAWTVRAAVGVALILAGNAIALARPELLLKNRSQSLLRLTRARGRPRAAAARAAEPHTTAGEVRGDAPSGERAREAESP
jgi:drug/metabolite transporter (DMT)-like permease